MYATLQRNTTNWRFMSYSFVGIVTKLLALIPAFDTRLGQELLSSPKVDIGPGAHTSSKWTQSWKCRGGGVGGGAQATVILLFMKTAVTSGAPGVTTWWQVTYVIIHPSTYSHSVRTGVPLPGSKETRALYSLLSSISCMLSWRA